MQNKSVNIDLVCAAKLQTFACFTTPSIEPIFKQKCIFAEPLQFHFWTTFRCVDILNWLCLYRYCHWNELKTIRMDTFDAIRSKTNQRIERASINIHTRSTTKNIRNTAQEHSNQIASILHWITFDNCSICNVAYAYTASQRIYVRPLLFRFCFCG